MTLDYAVVSVPRLREVPGDPTLNIFDEGRGEAMAIGRSHSRRRRKALRFDGVTLGRAAPRSPGVPSRLRDGTEGRSTGPAARGGATLEEPFESTKIDPWLDQMFLSTRSQPAFASRGSRVMFCRGEASRLLRPPDRCHAARPGHGARCVVLGIHPCL